jgi:hypothetical protein
MFVDTYWKKSVILIYWFRSWLVQKKDLCFLRIDFKVFCIDRCKISWNHIYQQSTSQDFEKDSNPIINRGDWIGLPYSYFVTFQWYSSGTFTFSKAVETEGRKAEVVSGSLGEFWDWIYTHETISNLGENTYSFFILEWRQISYFWKYMAMYVHMQWYYMCACATYKKYVCMHAYNWHIRVSLENIGAYVHMQCISWRYFGDNIMHSAILSAYYLHIIKQSRSSCILYESGS